MGSISQTTQIPRRLKALMQKVEAGELTIENGMVTFAGWTDEHEANRESIHALVRMSAGNPGFHCQHCGNWFQPKPKQWIFYLLCDTCFAAFDTQQQERKK